MRLRPCCTVFQKRKAGRKAICGRGYRPLLFLLLVSQPSFSSGVCWSVTVSATTFESVSTAHRRGACLLLLLGATLCHRSWLTVLFCRARTGFSYPRLSAFVFYRLSQGSAAISAPKVLVPIYRRCFFGAAPSVPALLRLAFAPPRTFSITISKFVP